MNLLAKFLTLEIPKNGKNNIFNAETIKDFLFAKIGVNSFAHPVLLLKSRDESTFIRSKNIRLKYLELAHNIECKITESGKVKIDYFSVITFRSTDENLQKYFFGVSESLIKSLSDSPTQKEVLDHFGNFIEIFQSLSDSPKKSLQGLWAELFVICNSKRPELLINHWHSNPMEKFDFNTNIEKIEVKSSSTLERIHTFSSGQLIQEKGKQVIIASVFVRQNSFGIDLNNLIEKICGRINSPELVDKIYQIVSKTLGNSIEQLIKIKFDFELAENSLCFYDVKDISKIEKLNIPYKVSEVKYKSDLSEVEAITKSDLKKYGKLYEAI